MKPPHGHRPGGPGRPPPGRGPKPGGPGRDFPNRGGNPPNASPNRLSLTTGASDQRPARSDAPRPQGGHHGGQTFQHRSDGPQRNDRRPRPAEQRHAPETPRGAVWLYGHHAVAAALANPQRRLRRLVITEDAEAALAEKLPPPWPLPPERVERARLDQLLGRDIAHQGVALLADPLAQPALASVLERSGPILVLDQVTDPRNVGAILRSAAAFGAAAVVVPEHGAPPVTGALAKAASGALEVVPLVRVVNLAQALETLKDAGFWCLGLDGAATQDLAALDLASRVALVLGAEGEGLRRLTRERCDVLVRLSTRHPWHSLNVSNAAAVALYDIATRKI